MNKTKINLDILLPEVPDEKDACVTNTNFCGGASKSVTVTTALLLKPIFASSIYLSWRPTTREAMMNSKEIENWKTMRMRRRVNFCVCCSLARAVRLQVDEANGRIESGKKGRDADASDCEEKICGAERIKREALGKIIAEEPHDGPNERHGNHGCQRGKDGRLLQRPQDQPEATGAKDAADANVLCLLQ